MFVRWKSFERKWTLWHRTPAGYATKTICGCRFNPNHPPELIDVQWQPKGIDQTVCKRCQ